MEKFTHVPQSTPSEKTLTESWLLREMCYIMVKPSPMPSLFISAVRCSFPNRVKSIAISDRLRWERTAIWFPYRSGGQQRKRAFALLWRSFPMHRNCHLPDASVAAASVGTCTFFYNSSSLFIWIVKVFATAMSQNKFIKDPFNIHTNTSI